MERFIVITKTFTTWNDAFDLFRGYKDVDTMKKEAKKLSLKFNRIMLYNGRMKMEIPTEVINAL